jgi:hypothetical protein
MKLPREEKNKQDKRQGFLVQKYFTMKGWNQGRNRKKIVEIRNRKIGKIARFCNIEREDPQLRSPRGGQKRDKRVNVQILKQGGKLKMPPDVRNVHISSALYPSGPLWKTPLCNF